MKVLADVDSEASWVFDKTGLITQNMDIVKESFSKLELPESLVREVVQNSLDAKLPDAALKILFSFNEVEMSNVFQYYASLLKHLEAEQLSNRGPVLSKEIISEARTSPMIDLLCIEDLGTTGLDGDVMNLESNFGAFFRGEGISSKEGVKGGRWGQGKTTFNMASKIKSFWGLTRRHSDSHEYLMGKSFLYPHLIDGETFVTSGLYTRPGAQPVSDPSVLHEFKKIMKCERKTAESGLSLVIPLPWEILTPKSIMQASLIHYFFPIIKKDLTILIRDSKEEMHNIDHSTIIDLADSLDWDKTSWERQETEDILEMLRFSQGCVELLLEDGLLELPNSVGSSYEINEEILQLAFDLESVIHEFNVGRLLGFKIPVDIKMSDNSVRSSHFFIFVKKYPNRGMTRSDEHYIRSGITISEEPRKLGGRPVRGIMYADDPVISELLGDAEEPMHTRWNELREGLREKYANHRVPLRFIRNAIRDIVKFLDMPTRETDYDLLEHIFSIPKPERPDKQEEEDDDKKVSEPGPDPPPPPPREAIFYVNQIVNGFEITSEGELWEYPVSGWLRVAYDVQRGNPFSVYESHDFDFTYGSIDVKIERGEISSTETNRIHFVFEHWKSRIQVTGFDENRDLIIRLGRVEK